MVKTLALPLAGVFMAVLLVALLMTGIARVKYGMDCRAAGGTVQDSGLSSRCSVVTP
jgi:hypothetical protein